MLDVLIQEQIDKLKNNNLEPKMIILGSILFMKFHQEKMGYTPYARGLQIQEIFGLPLMEDLKSKDRIDVLGSYNK